MQESPGVRVDSIESITLRFLQHRKEFNTANTEGSYAATAAIIAYVAYTLLQVKFVKEFVYQTAYPDILVNCQHRRGFELRVSLRGLRHRLAFDRSDSKSKISQTRCFSNFHIR